MAGRSVRSTEIPIRPTRTLAELGVGDGALLALRELPGDGSAGRDSATTQRTIRGRRSARNEQPGGRPLSDRSARLLPVRLSIPARCLTVLGALARGGRGRAARDDRESGVLGPAEFTRPARLSPRGAGARGVGAQRLPRAARADDRGVRACSGA